MADPRIRCGDHVRHEPTGEEWVVAYVRARWLCPCGWPEGEARLGECTLLDACSDDEHADLLFKLAYAGDGRRARFAREDFAALHPGVQIAAAARAMRALATVLVDRVEREPADA